MSKKEILNPLKGISPWGWHWEQQVYCRKGITRTIKAGQGSGNYPKVIKTFKFEVQKGNGKEN